MIFFTEEMLKDIENKSIFAEVEVGGQPVDDADDQNAQGNDYTTPEPVNAAGADNTGGGEDNPPPADEGGEDEGTDYTAEGDDAGGEDPAAGGDDAGDERDADYTQGGDAGGDEAPPEEGGDAGGGSSGGSGEPVTADDARGLENELFKDLTPDQVDLKHKELKKNFGDLYDSIANIVDRVNEIPNNDAFTAAIGFASNQLSDLKQMVADYMNDVYSTKSYMENAMNYNKFLATLNGIKDILEEINKELAQEEGK